MQNNNFESSKRNNDINLKSFKNIENNEKDVKHGRNAKNKSMIIIQKKSLEFNEDIFSISDPDVKINIKTNSENIKLENQDRRDSSINNRDNNSNFFDKFQKIYIFNKNLNFHLNKTKNNSIYNSPINERCLICDDELNKNEKGNNYIECHHALCSCCYYNYLKENIDTNNVINIKCPEKDCKKILYNNFIEKMLINDTSLLEKYKKFLNRRQLILNPNIQLCPFPDCESYAKKGKNKYVTCVHNNHKFCLKCLKDWHGKRKCKINIMDEKFEHWRNPSRVKTCPKCKYFIEKNDGCNHITCFNCQYEFCWLCMNEFTSKHYKRGKCSGLQFSRYE